MLRSRLPALPISRISKRSQFLLSETLVIAFASSATTLFQDGAIRWAPLVPCMIACFASFLLMLSTRCDSCDEPVGRNHGHLMAIPHTHCTRCGRDLR